MVENLVLGALLGRLDEVIDGVAVERPVGVHQQRPAPVLAYLESVTVSGFRGIGPPCELRLSAGPGLVLVVGRNGSGKSSIAEAAELALTGDSRRWLNKTADWKSGWRNLHTDEDPAIAVGLRVDGERQPRTVRVSWETDDLDSTDTVVTVPGQGRQTLDSLGWSTAVKTFRPFLSYKELSTIVEGRPVDRYNELAPMLGMESLLAPVEDLRQARLASEKQHRTAVQHVTRVVESLGTSSDDRASTASNALTGEWDLDKIEALLTGTDPAGTERENVLAALTQLPSPDLNQVEEAATHLRSAAARLDELRGSDGDRARRLAGLLQAAVEIHEEHGDADCPVCGHDNGLHGERVAELREEIRRLRYGAQAVEDAQRAAHNAREAAREAVGTIPRALGEAARVGTGIDVSDLATAWRAWTDTPDGDAEFATHLESACLPVIDATTALRSAATSHRRQLAVQWRPIAAELAEMLPEAREAERVERHLGPLKHAERWLKDCQSAIRDERFDAVKAQVKEVWETLAVGSNVTLEDVRLGTKKVDMDVTVDGDASAALGVMSQGELHALALSLFIPRVKSDASPFRFAMLDDPVQAMDPTRVGGLARVLEKLAQTRQVVVFTHDDRLSEAVRRLQIRATILAVTRRPKSLVELRKSLDPVRAAIGDARALTHTAGLPEEVKRRVVPGLCRQAIEAGCLESGRRKLLAAGMGLDECEDAWAEAVKLVPRIAIALYGDAQRHSDVYGTLNRKFGRQATDTVKSCDKMTHVKADPGLDLEDLVNRAEILAKNLAAL